MLISGISIQSGGLLMSASVEHIKEYWNERFTAEGKIWGELPSETARYALGLFLKNNVQRILVPGSGYGRNTKLFSASGFDVTGVEISDVACSYARVFDLLTKFYCGSVLDMSFDPNTYDAIYCFNVLHLFRKRGRRLLVQQCINKVKDNGLLFFTTFSEKESSYGKGKRIERDTFESRPGRCAHYFTKDDLREHFRNVEVVESGIMEDPENHGGEAHIHILRYIYCVNRGI